MKAIIDSLTKLGKEIEEAKSSVASLEGRKTEVLNRLKEEFGVSTVGEAEKLLAEYKGQVVELEEKITAGFETLKQNFDW